MLFINPIEHLQSLADNENLKAILKYTDSKDLDVRLASIRALTAVGGEEAVYALVPMLSKPEPEIRAAAARALGLLSQAVRSETHTKAHLIKRLQQEKDESVLEALHESLNMMIGKA